MHDWLYLPGDNYLFVALSAVVIFSVLIALVRVVGLRSFSKMTSTDFAMTVAVGSVIASTLVSESPPVLRSVIALGSLFAIQFVISLLRKYTPWMEKVVDNEPLVLMAGERMLRDNLRRARVTENDVWAKLREANVLDPKQVRAVVFETTGDIAVLHGEADGEPLHPCILRGVRDDERLDFEKDDDYEG